MISINDRLDALEQALANLQASLGDTVKTNTEQNTPSNTSVVGTIDRSTIRPIDAISGRSRRLGGSVIWNNAEIDAALKHEPAVEDMTAGYNKHSHSRFSGGALIKDVLEIVEYVWGAIVNKDCQQYYSEQPKVATDVNSNGETVDKIGKLDLIFNADALKWGTVAYEIDVRKCYFVMRDENGDIMTDDNGNEMKAPLFNDDVTKTSIVWDKDGGVWRLYSAYAPGD